MAINLLDELKSRCSDDVFASLGMAIGESEAATRRAVGAILPVVLGRLVTLASTGRGASDLLKMVRWAHLDGNRMDFLPATFGNRNAASDLATLGGPLAERLFDLRQDATLEWLSSFAGISRQSAASLLRLLVPVVMDFALKRATSDGGLHPRALSGLLGDQMGFLRVLPEGLASAAGLPSFARPSGRSMVSAPTGTRRTFAWLKWALPPAALLLTLVGMRTGRTVDATNAGRVAAPTVTSVYGIDLGAWTSRRLPNGVALTAPSNGVEAGLVDFLENRVAPVSTDRWFTLDRVEFEPGSAALKPSATEQLRNIVDILRAFPAAKIKVGGYTDTTGNPAANLQLSEDRAITTRKAIVDLGIAPERLLAEGYGEEHPVASNDTAEGRQRNRRIDVRFTSK